MESNGSVPFEELFPDQTINRVGRQINLSITYNNQDVLVSTTKRLVRGRVYEWVLNTIQHICGTERMYAVEQDEDLFAISSSNIASSEKNFILGGGGGYVFSPSRLDLAGWNAFHTLQ